MFSKNKLTSLVTLSFFAVFLILFCAFSLYRLYALQIFHYDFGIFTRIIWQLSRFQLPTIDHRVLGSIIFLGDHFNPSLIFLAPLFWITSDIRILLIEQALFTVLSGLTIFLIARKLKFSHIYSLIFAFVFLIFAGTENPLVTDWHPEPTAGFFLILFFYLFNFTSSRWLSYISALIFLGFKESNALTLVFLLTWDFFLKTGRRKEILRLVLFSIFWFVLTTKVFIPFFAKQAYMYTPQIPNSIEQTLTNYFSSPLKVKLIFDSLISFGFLPLFSLGIIPIMAELGIRLVPDSSIFQSFNLTFHYNVYLGIFLTLATIYGVKNIISFLSLRGAKRRGNLSNVKLNITGLLHFVRNDIDKIALIILSSYLLVISLYTARKITSSPINFAISPIFWRELQPRQDFLEDIKLVPTTGSVMSQNNLLPYLVTRQDKVYFLFETYEKIKPNIILIDISSGQNPNNFWDANYDTAKKIVSKLLKDPFYKRITTENKNLFLFEKK